MKRESKKPLKLPEVLLFVAIILKAGNYLSRWSLSTRYFNQEKEVFAMIEFLDDW
jgi:hypothetical protein